MFKAIMRFSIALFGIAMLLLMGQRIAAESSSVSTLSALAANDKATASTADNDNDCSKNIQKIVNDIISKKITEKPKELEAILSYIADRTFLKATRAFIELQRLIQTKQSKNTPEKDKANSEIQEKISNDITTLLKENGIDQGNVDTVAKFYSYVQNLSKKDGMPQQDKLFRALQDITSKGDGAYKINEIDVTILRSILSKDFRTDKGAPSSLYDSMLRSMRTVFSQRKFSETDLKNSNWRFNNLKDSKEYTAAKNKLVEGLSKEITDALKNIDAKCSSYAKQLLTGECTPCKEKISYLPAILDKSADKLINSLLVNEKFNGYQLSKTPLVKVAGLKVKPKDYECNVEKSGDTKVLTMKNVKARNLPAPKDPNGSKWEILDCGNCIAGKSEITLKNPKYSTEFVIDQIQIVYDIKTPLPNKVTAKNNWGNAPVPIAINRDLCKDIVEKEMPADPPSAPAAPPAPAQKPEEPKAKTTYSLVVDPPVYEQEKTSKQNNKQGKTEDSPSDDGKNNNQKNTDKDNNAKKTNDSVDTANDSNSKTTGNAEVDAELKKAGIFSTEDGENNDTSASTRGYCTFKVTKQIGETTAQEIDGNDGKLERSCSQCVLNNKTPATGDVSAQLTASPNEITLTFTPNDGSTPLKGTCSLKAISEKESQVHEDNNDKGPSFTPQLQNQMPQMQKRQKPIKLRIGNP